MCYAYMYQGAEFAAQKRSGLSPRSRFLSVGNKSITVMKGYVHIFNQQTLTNIHCM